MSNRGDSKFKLDFTNICGLKSNLNSVFSHLQNQSPGVLALSETQVFNDNDIGQYDCPGYSFTSAFFPHRGVGIYIRNDIPFSRLSHFEIRAHAKFAFIWLKIVVNHRKIYFCFLYRSSELSSDLFFEELDQLSSTIDSIYNSCHDAEIIVAGDFNIHNQRWLIHSPRTDLPGLYTEVFSLSNSMSQLVDEPTYIPRQASINPSLLDLFLTTDPFKYSVKIEAPLGNSDHVVVSASFQCALVSKNNSDIPNRLVWHYKNAKWPELNSYFQNFDWSICFHGDVDSATTMITNTILCGMRRFIPFQIIKRKTKSLSWFSEACKRAVHSKNSAFSVYKQNPTTINRESYVSARNTCNSTIAHDKHVFGQKIKEKILNCTKGDRAFWNIVGSINKNFTTSSSIPPLVDGNGNTIINSSEKANLLASKFSSNSILNDFNRTPPIISHVTSHMKDIYFRGRAVTKVLLDLNVNKAAGPDGIPPKVLKMCAQGLTKPLRRLFYYSYSSGIFPTSWKFANVQPVPKKGSRSDPSNYRPIAITSILSKVMEKIINRKLMSYLEVNKLLSDRQYGFRSKRSTGDLMTCLTDRISRSIHGYGESHILSLDIAKAFDRVWHKALLAKLLAFGVGDTFNRWISNFLYSRSIRVVLDGISSSSFPIDAGVPQGSALSPTLFLIFINDLLSSTENSIHSFADDSSLHYSYQLPRQHSSNDVTVAREAMASSINSDLVRIRDWSKVNLVEFNVSKTQACIFTNKRTVDIPPIVFNSEVICEAPNLISLGMSMSENNVWHDHMVEATKKAASRIGFLRRAKLYLNSENLALIYKSFIRPVLEYNSHIWAGAPAASKRFVDKIQKRAIKMINDEAFTSSFDSLDHRRTVASLCLFYRYFNRDCSVEISELMPRLAHFPVRTRRNANMHRYSVDIEFARTDRLRNSFIPRTSRIWNSLPNFVFPNCYDLKSFKTNIIRHLRDNPLRIIPGQSYPVV